MKQKLNTEKIKEFEDIIKKLNAEKLRLSTTNKSVCEHSWINTGMFIQGRSLMVCTKCRETKQTVLLTFAEICSV